MKLGTYSVPCLDPNRVLYVNPHTGSTNNLQKPYSLICQKTISSTQPNWCRNILVLSLPKFLSVMSNVRTPYITPYPHFLSWVSQASRPEILQWLGACSSCVLLIILPVSVPLSASGPTTGSPCIAPQSCGQRTSQRTGTSCCHSIRLWTPVTGIRDARDHFCWRHWPVHKHRSLSTSKQHVATYRYALVAVSSSILSHYASVVMRPFCARSCFACTERPLTRAQKCMICVFFLSRVGVIGTLERY